MSNAKELRKEADELESKISDLIKEFVLKNKELEDVNISVDITHIQYGHIKEFFTVNTKVKVTV